jgi:hypothetical protein
MHMAMNGTGLVEQLKDRALKWGTLGVRYVVEGTVSAVKLLDRLQELMPKQEREPRVTREPAQPLAAQPRVDAPSEEVRAEARATAERVLEEARAAQERLREARPARHPLKVSAAEALEEETPATPKRRATARKTPRTQGRKTTASATAPKRATAPQEGFKAKRGQKLKH